MTNFFQKLLPAEGLVCVAEALSPQGFRHYFFDTIEEATAQIQVLDEQGKTVYLAQATFDTQRVRAAQANNKAIPFSASKEDRKAMRHKERSQENSQWLRNFFLDIDCGVEKHEKNPNTAYPSQKDAYQALKEFVAESGLPFPAIVNSGNGLYAHWIMVETVPAEQWRSIAHMLKQTLTAHGFKQDPSRTSDSASVLRPVGSTNRKRGEEKQVKLLRDMEPFSFLEFVQILRKAAKKKHVNVEVATAPKPATDVNADFYAGLDDFGPRPEADGIAAKCAQVGHVAKVEGNVEEPLWYATIGLLSFCETDEDAADEKIHAWSAGHPDYSQKTTEAKITQFRSTGMGPTTCAHFGSINPSACIGCKHINKIKSPIVLGRPEPKAIETEPEQIETPKGYRRAADGLYFEDEGRWTKFYDCDLVPIRLAKDESLGAEVTTVRHTLPHEGTLEFTFKTSLIHDQKAILSCLTDNHVKVVGTKEKKVMVEYMESYMQMLQRNRRMSQLLCQMGWREERGEPFFVLGKKIIRPDGSVDDAALAKNVPHAAMGYRTSGTLEAWSAMTSVFDQPCMEPLAFALLCSFGAPLMKFTGFDGALVSMTGDSGIGKTLLLRMAQSVYGHHNELMMLRDDTRNALISRLGVYGTLPLTVDEVTNIDGVELSDLVYRITQGRDKARLTKNAEERKVLNSWNTIALVSTNSSLIDKLGSLKHDASAEINRVFEYPVAANPLFSGQVTTDVYWCLNDNYGTAGVEYVRYLVQNIQKIKPGLDAVRQMIDGNAKIRGEERFWSAVASAAIYGGLVAKKLGIIQFDVKRVLGWATETIKNMRDEKDELASNAVDILGQFLDEHAANRLLVRGDCGPGKVASPIDTPRGALVYRHEVDNQKIYISKQTFKSWLGKKFGSYTKVKNELEEIGALKDANARKVLGGGTQYGGAQQSCWVIDLKCHKLGNVGLTLVQEAELLKRGAV